MFTEWLPVVVLDRKIENNPLSKKGNAKLKWNVDG